MKMEGERKKRSSRDNREVYYHKRGKKKKKKKTGCHNSTHLGREERTEKAGSIDFFFFSFKTKQGRKKKPYNLKEKKTGRKGRQHITRDP